MYSGDQYQSDGDQRSTYCLGLSFHTIKSDKIEKAEKLTSISIFKSVAVADAADLEDIAAFFLEAVLWWRLCVHRILMVSEAGDVPLPTWMARMLPWVSKEGEEQINQRSRICVGYDVGGRLL